MFRLSSAKYIDKKGDQMKWKWWSEEEGFAIVTAFIIQDVQHKPYENQFVFIVPFRVEMQSQNISHQRALNRYEIFNVGAWMKERPLRKTCVCSWFTNKRKVYWQLTRIIKSFNNFELLCKMRPIKQNLTAVTKSYHKLCTTQKEIFVPDNTIK